MSGYHYDERGCSNCFAKTMYVPLSKTTDYECDKPCTCRFSNERSDKDKMYYNWFVLGKPMVLPPGGQQLATPHNQNCGK